MLSTVELDDEFRPHAEEIDDIALNRMLAAKFEAAQSAIP